LKADCILIILSVAIFVAAMLLGGLLFLPIDPYLKAQIETFTAYTYTTSIIILAIVGITSVFKRKF
jgi:hypothetical protein